MIKKTKFAAAFALLTLTGVTPARVQADDVTEKPVVATGVTPADVRSEGVIETAGVATGVTVGNTIVVPVKAATMLIGALSGALSFIVTGGNAELTQQIWRDTSQGPYLVTPELARKSIGRRPELELRK